MHPVTHIPPLSLADKVPVSSSIADPDAIKEQLAVYRPYVNRLTCQTGITTTLATFIIVISAIIITGALLCLTLPGVNIQKIQPTLVFASFAIASSLPLIFWSRKCHLALANYINLWVAQLLPLLSIDRGKMDETEKSKLKDFSKEVLFHKIDGKDFNLNIVKMIAKQEKLEEKSDFIQALNEGIQKLHEPKIDEED